MTITRAQRLAFHRVYLRHPAPRSSYRHFRRTAFPCFGVLMVPFAGMLLGIEPDGHTHS